MKSFSNTINSGEKVRLRDDVLPLMKRKSWTFAGTSKGDIILFGHEYVWKGKADSIDSEEYQRRRDLDHLHLSLKKPQRSLPEDAR